MECKNIDKCSFFNCCEELKKDNQVEGFRKMFCNGDKMTTCIRLKLSSNFGKEVVPKNMMPNGYPIPGTTKEGWSEQALNYRSLF